MSMSSTEAPFATKAQAMARSRSFRCSAFVFDFLASVYRGLVRRSMCTMIFATGLVGFAAIDPLEFCRLGTLRTVSHGLVTFSPAVPPGAAPAIKLHQGSRERDVLADEGALSLAPCHILALRNEGRVLLLVREVVMVRKASSTLLASSGAPTSAPMSWALLSTPEQRAEDCAIRPEAE